MSGQPDVDLDAFARRAFLKRMAAALALAGTSGGCQRAPAGRILPYASPPPEVVPGNPRLYATAISIDGYAQGVLALSREGRPIKVEGNPDHPATLGAAGPFEQASVLGLYDPDRAQAVQRWRAPETWHAVIAALSSGRWRKERGKGLAIVLEATGSLVIADLLARLRRDLPEVDVHWASAAPRTATWNATRAAFGLVLEPRYHLTRADVVLVLDDDPVARGPAWMRWARHTSDRRRSPKDGMSRLYTVEPRLTPTGASSDHRLAVRRSEIGAIAAAILAELAPPELASDGARALLEGLRARSRGHARFLRAVARDLLAHRGRGIVIVGDTQPPEVHLLAHAIDAALGNLGATKTFGDSPLLEAGESSHDLTPLAQALDARAVDTLLVLGPNVVHTAPADLRFGERIATARESFYLGEYDDESARACTSSAPLAHVLETWGDARAFDGTRSIVQPLIAPLRGGRTVSQALMALIGDPDADDYRLVQTSMQPRLRAPFATSWDDALVRGIVPGSALPDVGVRFRWASVEAALRSLPPPTTEDAIELAFDLDRRVHDGRFTNIAWLAELPEPMTTLTWGNALLVARTTAERLGLADEKLARVEAHGRSLEVPVLVADGQAEGQLSLTLGWGRSKALSVGGGYGANANELRAQASLWSTAARVQRTDRSGLLAIVQKERDLHGREEQILPRGTVAELREKGRIGRRPEPRPVALYANRPIGTSQWGMVIDLNACTGCSSCVVACQAENNVPTVGFAAIRKGREMHWLAINLYRADEGSLTPQPMLCQHCEQAPCEYVCPVGATTHSADGLNEMTYNRCVGTRFCSNNCPYKVRRFNWFKLNPDEPTLASLAHNPDVTVRARGVMEKCTYCVQRIRRGEIRATVDGRNLRDGEVVTACQQACPTNAITFGDIADPTSKVAKLRADETRLYAVLDELGTVPRTLYLARVTNPNPELA